MQRPTITLTTDFGLSGSYVAQLKGVSLGGLVYVYYRKGVPPDYGDSPEILIFPEPAPKAEE